MRSMKKWLLLLLVGFLMGCQPVLQVFAQPEPVLLPAVLTATAFPMGEDGMLFSPTVTPVGDTTFLRLVTAIEPLLPGVVTNVFVGNDGVLWLASDRGVGRIFANERRAYLARFWDFVVGPDGEGRMWVIDSQRGQISAWDGLNWVDYDAGQGWYWFAVDEGQDPAQPGMYQDEAGGYWLVTAQDVRRFDGRRWRVYSQEEMGLTLAERAAMQVLISMAVSPTGDSVWVGTCHYLADEPVGGGGLRWFDGLRWQAGDLPALGCVQGVGFDALGRLWVGVDGTLWLRSMGSWQPWTAPMLDGELRHAFVRELAMDAHGGVWPLFGLCAKSGCDVMSQRYHWLDGKWQVVNGLEALEHGQVLFDRQGNTWLFGSQAIARLVEDEWREVARLRIYSVWQDAEGQIWLAARFNETDAIWRLESD